MSGISSPRREQRIGGALFAAWLIVLLDSVAALLLFPSRELFAIEVVVLAFALLYGFGVWPVAPTIASLVVFGVVAALVMFPRATAGDLPPPELIEVVAPVALAGVVIFHVRRREEAIHQTNLMAEANRRRAAARERLSRMTSHELRTPLTIATAYVEHLLEAETGAERREDLQTIRDELTQLERLCERLVRAVALDLGAPEDSTDLGAVLDEVRRRWDMVVDRDLVVAAEAPTARVNADRLRAALDTLIENSVRYTGPGDRIHLFSRAVDGDVEVGVADSGSGLSSELIERVNNGSDLSDALPSEVGADADDIPHKLRDMYSQTGFGLRIVAAIARSAGGRLVASRSEHGGARIALRIPAEP